jgi:hypothetical protein
MRHTIIWASISLATLGSPWCPALAIDIVSDPVVETNSFTQIAKDVEAAARRIEMINNQLIQIENLEQTLAAVSHGNLSALGTLFNELGALGIVSPLGSDATQLLSALAKTGSDLAQTANVTQGIIASGQLFAPTGTDPRALFLNSVAQVLAAQRSIAQNSLASAMAYQQNLLTLRRSLGSTADIKAATDAGARLQGETASQMANANQMLALIYQQRTQQALLEAQQEQTWRCWSEVMTSQASAMASSASSGPVTLTGPSLGNLCQQASISASINSAGSGTLTADMTGSVFTSGTSSTSTSTTSTDGNSVLAQMTSQSWGQQAASNAMALGVNPTALAATCVMESNCSSNVGGTGTISGAFQMSNGTYAQTVSEVTASDPTLAAQITSKNDAASQSIAASQYLLDGVTTLQSSGIANPTVLDVRGYYQFGPANAVSITNAPDNQLMSTALTGLSSATLAANGITSTTTVGQWRATVTNRLGSAANQSVLLGSAL